MTEMTVRAQKAAGGMLALTASAHFLNDMIQSVIPASIRCQSGEYTLSENYVHGLAAFGTRLKNFESPHSSRGSSPGLPAGNSVTVRKLADGSFAKYFVLKDRIKVSQPVEL